MKKKFYSREYWQAHIDIWQKSGQSKKAYCLDNNLAYNTFANWRKRLVIANKGSTDFIEIDIAGKKEKQSTKLLLEIVLMSDMRLRLNLQVNLKALFRFNEGMSQ